MFGYKGFDKDLCCRGFQYEVGKVYEMEDAPDLCIRGFHFCTRLSDVDIYYPFLFYRRELIECPKYYSSTTNSTSLYGNNYFYDYWKEYAYDSNCRYCEVQALGEIVPGTYLHSGADTKHVTNKIKIIRELDRQEVNHILSAESANPMRFSADYFNEHIHCTSTSDYPLYI